MSLKINNNYRYLGIRSQLSQLVRQLQLLYLLEVVIVNVLLAEAFRTRSVALFHSATTNVLHLFTISKLALIQSRVRNRYSHRYLFVPAQFLFPLFVQYFPTGLVFYHNHEENFPFISSPIARLAMARLDDAREFECSNRGRGDVCTPLSRATQLYSLVTRTIACGKG